MRSPSTGSRSGRSGLDLGAMMGRKDKVVTTLTRGVEFLFRKNKVDWLKGKARIVAPGRIAMAGADGAASEVEATSIIIATGSESTRLPGIDIDEKRIVSSTGALSLDRVPERLTVIGGGYIGLELGLCLAPARRQGDRRRGSRPHRPEHGSGARHGIAAGPHAVGARLQARHQGGGHPRRK